MACTVVLALIGLVCAAQTAAWFSGDAIIHLTLAEHVAQGRLFEFNLGEPSGASSSPLLTLLGGACIRLGGIALYVYALKAAALSAWFLTFGAVLYIARGWGVARTHALWGAAVATCLPGSVWNWFQGSENGLFACVVLLQIAQLTRCALLLRPAPLSSFVLGLLAAIGMGLRPEGCVCALTIAIAYLDLVRTLKTRARAVLALLFLVPLLSLGLAPYALAHAATGQWFSDSAYSRVMMARRQSFALHLGPLWLYPRVLLRFAAYAPAVALAVLGRPRLKSRSQVGIVQRAAFALLIVGVLGYTCLGGAAHTARYLIWLFALVGLFASTGIARLRAYYGRSPQLLALASVWLCVVSIGELVARERSQGERASGAALIAAPAQRKNATDELLMRACSGGCCAHDRKPEFAISRVEERFFVDDRVVIRSLDGVAAGAYGKPVRYLPNGCPIIDDFFDDQHIVAFLEAADTSPFFGCRYEGRTAAMNAVWSGTGPAPAGFRFGEEPEPMLLRVCDHAASQ